MATPRGVSLRHLRSFVEIAGTQSFTLAAARLFVTQSSLTATIQQFESAAGLRLFDRTTRRVTLTREGEHFLPEAREILRRFDSAIDDLASFGAGKKGHIRIAAAVSVIYRFLVEAMEALRSEHPELAFTIRDAGSQHVEQMVLEGEIDFAIASRHRGHELLDYAPVLRDHYGVLCHPLHPLSARRGPLPWADLPTGGFVAFTPDTGIGSFLAEHQGHLPIFAKPHDKISSTTSLYAVMGASPSAWSIVPALAADIDHTASFVFRELREPGLVRELCLITRRLRSMSPGAGQLLERLMRAIESTPLPPGVSVSRGAAKQGVRGCPSRSGRD